MNWFFMVVKYEDVMCRNLDAEPSRTYVAKKQTFNYHSFIKPFVKVNCMIMYV